MKCMWSINWLWVWRPIMVFNDWNPVEDSSPRRPGLNSSFAVIQRSAHDDIRVDAPLNPFLSLPSHQPPYSTHSKLHVAAHWPIVFVQNKTSLPRYPLESRPRFQCQRMVIKERKTDLALCRWTNAPIKTPNRMSQNRRGPAGSFFNRRSSTIIPGQTLMSQRTPFHLPFFMHACPCWPQIPRRSIDSSHTLARTHWHEPDWWYVRVTYPENQEDEKESGKI